MLGRVLLIFFMGLPWQDAAAAPWILEPGKVYTRASIANERIEGLTAWRGDLYGEYGLPGKAHFASLKLEAISYAGCKRLRCTRLARDAPAAIDSIGRILGLNRGRAARGCCHWRSRMAATHWAQRFALEAHGQDNGGSARVSPFWKPRAGSMRRVSAIGSSSGSGSNCQRISGASHNIGSSADRPMPGPTRFNQNSLWRDGSMDYSFGYRNENGGAFIRREHLSCCR